MHSYRTCTQRSNLAVGEPSAEGTNDYNTKVISCAAATQPVTAALLICTQSIMSYPFHEIEPRWQRYWLEQGTFHTDTTDTSRPKYYVLGMFPYPSGEGLHIGHPESYTAVDIIARYKRHRGFNVLNPMGWDAFGLPAEQYAMKTNVHPRVTTQKNIDNYRRQLQSIGFGYDWSREVNTTDPGYYRWSQWIFLKLYNSWFDRRTQQGRPIDELRAELARDGSANLALPRRRGRDVVGMTADEWNAMDPLVQQNYLAEFRLAYEAEIPVNWCDALGSVLANEEVDEWAEKGYSVERRPMRQWMMRITDYADRLLAGHELIDWPASTIEMQREWIGRSNGAELTFAVELGADVSGTVASGVAEPGEEIRVFTTRPDTLFGVTFITVAPEYPSIDRLVTPEQRDEVEAYRRAASLKSELDRQIGEEKTGVFTGSYAIHPGSGARVPIWTGDYVLAGYGTGAVMGVPAHDERDFEFARTFGLPIQPVIEPRNDYPDHDAVMKGEACYTGAGTMRNSGAYYDGMESEEAKGAIVQGLGEKGRATIQYKLRDWLFSRQRYWGEPIPIIKYENGIIESLDERELPLILPEMEEFKPSGSTESPLALATDWLTVEHPKHGTGRRETNTMPQWAGSSWYYIRYVDPHNDQAMIDPKLAEHWLPVDFYIGGAEHSVTHLLYSRFWHKVLFDLGYAGSQKPFQRVLHQGMVLGENGQKMSKSRGNVVNPDEIIKEYGADALRLFEMFMGPLEMAKPWSSKGIEGVRRFLNRAWRMLFGNEEADLPAQVVDRPMTEEEERILHATIRKVTEDIEGVRFNTAVSALMVFVNEFLGVDEKPREAMEAFAKLLSPFAPHIAEEFWGRLGHNESISSEPWPAFDPAKLVESQIEIVVQINSKIKGKLHVAPGTTGEELERLALETELVQGAIDGKSIRKVIAVPDRLVNIIVG